MGETRARDVVRKYAERHPALGYLKTAADTVWFNRSDKRIEQEQRMKDYLKLRTAYRREEGKLAECGLRPAEVDEYKEAMESLLEALVPTRETDAKP